MTKCVNTEVSLQITFTMYKLRLLKNTRPDCVIMFFHYWLPSFAILPVGHNVQVH